MKAKVLLLLWVRTTHFDVKLHFGDQQFEVDAAQLSIAFTQVTLGGGRELRSEIIICRSRFTAASNKQTAHLLGSYEPAGASPVSWDFPLFLEPGWVGGAG